MPSLSPSFRRMLIRMLASRTPLPEFGRQNLKALIFKPDRLGDFILATGAIRCLCKAFGAEHCALVVTDFTAELARHLFGGCVVIGVPFAHNDLLRGVLPGLAKARPIFRQYHFSKLLSLRHQRTIYQELLLSRLAADQSVGVLNEPDCILPSDVGVYEYSFTTTVEYPKDAPEGACCELEAHRRVLSIALDREVSMDEIIPRLEFSPAPGQPKNLVVVAPFGSTDIRTYPLPLLIRALQAVQKELRCHFALSGAPGDAARLAELDTLARQAGIANVSVLTPSSFLEFCSIVAAARGVISVDTSTAHLAVAMDKPAAIVLGGGHYGQFGPWQRSNRQVWLTHGMPCFGCGWECIHPEPYCITQVSPEALAAALLARM